MHDLDLRWRTVFAKWVKKMIVATSSNKNACDFVMLTLSIGFFSESKGGDTVFCLFQVYPEGLHRSVLRNQYHGSFMVIFEKNLNFFSLVDEVLN